MRSFLYPLAAISLVGFTVSALVHIYSSFGWSFWESDPTAVLHIGAMITFVPIVIITVTSMQEVPQDGIWKQLLRGLPPWIRYVGYLLFVYAAVNFLLRQFLFGGNAVNDSNLFSSGWLISYGVSAAVYLSLARTKTVVRRCINGHVVATDQSNCPECGNEVLNDA